MNTYINKYVCMCVCIAIWFLNEKKRMVSNFFSLMKEISFKHKPGILKIKFGFTRSGHGKKCLDCHGIIYIFQI